MNRLPKILSLENISINYGSREIVHDVSFNINSGEILAIVGESGSGKSTLLKAIQHLLGRSGKITQGKILIEGRDLSTLDSESRRKLAGEFFGMIFQNSSESFCPIRKVGDQIFESVRAHCDWDRAEFMNRAEKILDRLDLDKSILDEYPFRLSGGMGQRAGILAAMILEPKILLADEPTSALDPQTQMHVAQKFLELRNQQNISILIVTHNLGLANFLADRILIMKDGCIIEEGSCDEIFKSPREIYTRDLIQAIPRFEYDLAS